jgi:hypothetical protein
MAVDPNLDLTRLTPPDGLRTDDSKGGNRTALEECAGIVAGKFQGHSVGCGRGWRTDDFSKAKCQGRSLGSRGVLAKRSISSGFGHVARDVSQLRNALVKGFARLRRDSSNKAAGDYFRGLEEELRVAFTPIFMSRGESAHALSEIRKFIDALLANAFDRRTARQIRGQCDCVLECGGAMALFGVLRSALRAVR